jgi:hypothetical protein
MSRRILLVIAFVGVSLMACCCAGVAPQKGNAEVPPPPETPEEFVGRFGKPDLDESNENDDPKPKTPTRRLYFKSEKVRAIFTSSDNQAPPRNWKLAALEADITGKAISEKEFLAVMAYRDSEKQKIGAKIDAEKKAQEVEKQAKAMEDLKEVLRPKAHQNVTRANFEKIIDGMTLFQVEEILGPGPSIKKETKEGGVLVVTWASGGPAQEALLVEGVTIITVTFRKNSVESKTIEERKHP